MCECVYVHVRVCVCGGGGVGVGGSAGTHAAQGPEIGGQATSSQEPVAVVADEQTQAVVGQVEALWCRRRCQTWSLP